MDENERDTHFKNGFANLLMQEIDEQVGAVVEWGLEHDIDSQEKIGQELYSRWQTIIARRAYDLALFLFESADPLHFDIKRSYDNRPGENVYDYKQFIKHLPDMTELP